MRPWQPVLYRKPVIGALDGLLASTVLREQNKRRKSQRSDRSVTVDVVFGWQPRAGDPSDPAPISEALAAQQPMLDRLRARLGPQRSAASTNRCGHGWLKQFEGGTEMGNAVHYSDNVD